MKSQKFVNVVRILIKRLRLKIHIFKKSYYYLLELLLHTVTQPRLHDAYNLVIMLHPQHNVTDTGEALFI